MMTTKWPQKWAQTGLRHWRHRTALPSDPCQSPTTSLHLPHPPPPSRGAPPERTPRGRVDVNRGKHSRCVFGSSPLPIATRLLRDQSAQLGGRQSTLSVDKCLPGQHVFDRRNKVGSHSRL